MQTTNPYFFLFTQKNEPKHIVYNFQIILKKFPVFYIVWKEAKCLSLPDLISRSITTKTQDERRQIKVETPDSLIFFESQPTNTTNTVPLCCIKRTH